MWSDKIKHYKNLQHPYRHLKLQIISTLSVTQNILPIMLYTSDTTENIIKINERSSSEGYKQQSTRIISKLFLIHTLLSQLKIRNDCESVYIQIVRFLDTKLKILIKNSRKKNDK